MNTKRVIVRSVLSAVIFFGCIGIAFAADEEELEVDFSPEVVANYIHAVIAADRALYTTHIVDRLQEERVVVAAEDVPAETGLHAVDFSRPQESPPKTYVTPDDAESCWKKPGPVAGPFKARPGDGSTVTYYWYRFADQPALLNADLTDQEREDLQVRVVKLHQHWTKDRDYLAPPAIGKLADIDPALIVTPPPGLEAGYVPIATRQATKE